MTPRIAEMMEKSGGRRFILALGAGVSTTVLQWFSKLDAAGNTYALVVIATVGAYLTANTVQKTKATAKEEADK